MFFSVQMNSFFHYWDRDSGTELVFVWPDQASVPVSQCPSYFGVAMLLGISESLCSSTFGGVAIVLAQFSFASVR